MRRAIRYAGRTENRETLRIRSEPDGTFVVRHGGGIVVLTPDAEGLRAELRPDAELRELAAALLDSARLAQTAPAN